MKILGGQIAKDSGVLFTQGEILDTKLQNQIRDYLGLRVSRIPLTLFIQVSLGQDSSEIRLRGRYKDQAVNVAIEEPGQILSDTWHPVRSSDLAEILDWLAKRGLGVGSNAFGDGLNLRANQQDCPVPIEFEIARAENAPRAHLKIANAKPYQYQIEGIRYLQYMSKTGVGCILADEMGLGKTLQVIAFLAEKQQEAQTPSLVVAPATLLENWRRELAKFAPQLNVTIRKAGARSFELNQFDKSDVVVTSYDTMAADIGLLTRFKWSTLVLDEAQYIKNPTAKRTTFAKRISSNFKIAVTGTPFENHLTDTWSLIDFVYPGYLSTLKEFSKTYNETIEDAQGLGWVVEPLVLRRLVADVAKDLPERIDVPVFLEPDSELLKKQSAILDEVRKPGGNMLAQIQNLRTLAAHAILDEISFKKSPKFDYLRDLLLEIFSRGEKALIFCSFNISADRITSWVESFWPNHLVKVINGGTPVDERQSIIDGFTDANSGVLVLNPQAAGVGLNITAANHVIHFNPEWNPALTEQASKRAHRNGQTKPVTVHYLFYTKTIEDIVANSQELKRAIGKALVPGVLLPLSEREALKRLLGLGD